jgi:23S rRNA (guanosine2251-2'-O)-methyltransferase
VSDKRPPLKRHVDPYVKGAKPDRRGDNPSPADDQDDTQGYISGRNAVIEALRANVVLDKVYIDKEDSAPALGHIASRARGLGAVVVDADRRKLEQLCRNAGLSVTTHQGVVAVMSVASYVDVADILELARSRGEAPLIIVCDEISDPHNLGAIIRTAEAAGAHGVIIPKRRNASLTPIVAKTSAGAAFHLPTAREANLAGALRELRESGVWIYGSASAGEKSMWETDFTGAAAIVVGSEGEGMGRLVRENCDFVVNIPMSGKISSLNASVSASLLLYEAVRQRGK